MLEVYKDKQYLFWEEVNNSISNHKISHAYMIETNNYSEKDELILAFIKTLFCTSYHLNSKNCGECNICHLIDNQSFSDFMIIEPDGAFIKKEQILKMKERFKTTSFQNGPRIYFIKEADKLNKQSANSLLKFLEEPEGNIIAILEVDNRYKVLETIRSRCQIYSLLNPTSKKEIENSDLVIEVIKTLENKNRQAIAYLPIVLENDYHTEDFWNQIFLDMITIYESALRKINGLKYSDYGDIIDFLIDKNDMSTLIHKIRILFDTMNHLNYNLNINMMLDNFIIAFSRR